MEIWRQTLIKCVINGRVHPPSLDKMSVTTFLVWVKSTSPENWLTMNGNLTADPHQMTKSLIFMKNWKLAVTSKYLSMWDLWHKLCVANFDLWAKLCILKGRNDVHLLKSHTYIFSSATNEQSVSLNQIFAPTLTYFSIVSILSFAFGFLQVWAIFIAQPPSLPTRL